VKKKSLREMIEQYLSKHNVDAFYADNILRLFREEQKRKCRKCRAEKTEIR
jgi:hypothetical protein